MSPAAALLRRLGPASRVAAVTSSLVGTQAATSVLGFAYWTIAARTCAVSAVGVAGAAVAAMTLLGTLGMLGLGTLLIGELPGLPPGRRRVVVRSALALAGLVSLDLGLVFGAGVQVVSASGLRAVSSSPALELLFGLGVGLTGLTLVLDQAVLAAGSGGTQLQRNIVASVAKIVALLVLTASGHRSGMAIYLAALLGTAVSLPVVAWRTRRTGRAPAGEDRRLIGFDALRGLGRSAAGHHVLNLVLQAPPQLLGLIVVVVLSAASNGYFSTVRLVAGFVFVLPFAMTIGLFAAARGDPAQVIARMRVTLPLGLAASLAADVVLWPAARPVLSAFGSGYATHGVWALRLLVLGGLPLVVKDHFVALRRVQGRTANAAVGVAVGALAEVGFAALGAHLAGVDGLCVGWVLALTGEAAVAAPVLWRASAAARRPAPDALVPGARLPDWDLLTEFSETP